MFGRKKRVYLGEYVEPAPVEAPPVERVVNEGALIGESVVRLVLRNRVIVDALREHKDLDRAGLARLAARELAKLAEHERESADRVEARRDRQVAADATRKRSALDPDDVEESHRRERLHREMAAAFAGRAADEALLDSLVERSLQEAWSEIGPVFLERAGEQSLVVDRDSRYDQERVDRVGTLLALDLTKLAIERGVEL